MSDLFLKGGFGYLILVNLAALIRSAFKSRALEVRTAKQLRSELEEDTRHVQAFCDSLRQMIATNQQRQQQGQNGWAYESVNVRPIATKYIRNSDHLFGLFSKHAPEAIGSLHMVLHRLTGYEQILGSHESYFIRARAMMFAQDPHTVLLQYAHSWGLETFNADVRPVLSGLTRIQEGGPVWRYLRRPWAYWPVKLVLFGLLMAVPARTDI